MAESTQIVANSPVGTYNVAVDKDAQQNGRQAVGLDFGEVVGGVWVPRPVTEADPLPTTAALVPDSEVKALLYDYLGNPITALNPTFAQVTNGAGAAAVNIQDGGNSITVDGTVSITANSSVNVAQIAGTATAVNAGNADNGTQRVILATDQSFTSGDNANNGSRVLRLGVRNPNTGEGPPDNQWTPLIGTNAGGARVTTMAGSVMQPRQLGGTLTTLSSLNAYTIFNSTGSFVPCGLGITLNSDAFVGTVSFYIAKDSANLTPLTVVDEQAKQLVTSTGALSGVIWKNYTAFMPTVSTNIVIKITSYTSGSIDVWGQPNPYMSSPMPFAYQAGTWSVGLNAGTNNIGDVDVLSLPSLPTGTNNIGDVDIASIAAGSNLIGDVALQPRSTATGWDTFRTISLLSTAQTIKGSAGKLGGYFAFNATTSTIYIKIYNLTSVNPASDVPVLVFPLPAGSPGNVEWANGIAFSTGIMVRCVTGVADTNTTSPSANGCIFNAMYK